MLELMIVYRELDIRKLPISFSGTWYRLSGRRLLEGGLIRGGRYAWPGSARFFFVGGSGTSVRFRWTVWW